MSVKSNIQKLKNDIPYNVQILAATKTRSVSQIKEAMDSGIKLFGENYVQEAEKKYPELKKENDIELYFIGYLQKNKINRALKIFDVINIDSYEIAIAIDERADKKVKVMIEVNIGEELQKHGCKPNEVGDLVEKISGLRNIEVIGIMAIAPLFDEAEKSRPYFKRMKEIFKKIKDDKIKILSMGMTNDYQVAIEEGSNQVRIGSLIFSR